MKSEVEARWKKDFLVLLDEEYGYRSWFWFPSMSVSELEKWWKKLDSVEPYFMTPKPLPGGLYQASEDEIDLFLALEKSGKYYMAHTHCDDDSFLINLDGKKLFHKGYSGK